MIVGRAHALALGDITIKRGGDNCHLEVERRVELHRCEEADVHQNKRKDGRAHCTQPRHTPLVMRRGQMIELSADAPHLGDQWRDHHIEAKYPQPPTHRADEIEVGVEPRRVAGTHRHRWLICMVHRHQQGGYRRDHSTGSDEGDSTGLCRMNNVLVPLGKSPCDADDPHHNGHIGEAVRDDAQGRRKKVAVLDGQHRRLVHRLRAVVRHRAVKTNRICPIAIGPHDVAEVRQTTARVKRSHLLKLYGG
mmetsp:Transcript_848/g.2603  ORF Transcript_848/g.2603 Transcript_848/m.2603 type:complete len:249 (-) Transcript_848:808-1554(-)